jgi:type I restriction-modification system DNA methylase subunit
MGRKLTKEEKSIIEKYGHLFQNTGGNDIIEFLGRTDINPFNNMVAFVMQSSLFTQLSLIQGLIKEGFLAA